MLALTITPGVADSLEVREVPAPTRDEGEVLVDALSVGLCGTDVEIIAGEFGAAPPGQDYLVLGHENLGRVAEAPAGSDLVAGDLVVGIVRRPDPVPCGACAAGEWDMCLNGRYSEHGIKELDGFARQQWRADPDALVKLDPGLERVGVLLEPATVVAKAWEQIERIGQRAYFEPMTVAVTGAGPVGLLAALIGIQRGLEVHVYDVLTEGPKPALVRDLGATYHTDSLQDSQVRPDVIIECTGVAPVILEAITGGGLNAITCLTGISGVGRKTPIDLGDLNRTAVLQNEVIFGTVNANKRHYTAAGEALAAADTSWLERLITRRVSIDNFRDAFDQQDDDVKVVLDF
ncbi:glucose 1-dehydrogenase [Arthrobacter sedimenti]|uniref:glucose 1-dehydrogenase n=1 Tax=Arthrobacter sedimenti TaxID=2694931 RepID=UPI000B3636FD|nr:glucose 1-dehydrogenase [Arthrobacter sedimenti]OUM42510.1 theronine dehydrogenase [Arthrobacter agilis]